MALGQGSLAGIARVSFEATGVGEITRDIDRVEASYRQSTEGMSDSAIKVELAQRRLQRALKDGPGSFDRQARAELGLRRAERELRGETDQLTRSQDRQRRGLGGLRSSVLAYAGAIGASTLFYALGRTLDAAREQELVLGQTQVALEAAGLSWEKYAQRIETVVRAQSRLGFDDEELLKTFQAFVRQTGDVDEALRRNALAADLARGRYMDLEAAAKLVLKASMGQAGALRRVGIDAENGSTGVELLRKLTEQYGQSAEKASTTGIAAQDRMKVAIENTKEAIGTGLLPTVTELTDRITKWLDTAENQEKLQRQVNAAMETAEDIVTGVARAFGFLDRNIGPIVDKLGGLDRVVEAVLISGLVFKSAKAVAAVRGLALSFGLVGPAAVRGAATANLATASIGTTALTATGRVGALRGSLLALGRMGPIPVTIALLVDQATGGHGWNAVTKAVTDEATAQSGNPRLVNGQWVGADGMPVQDQRYWQRLFRRGFIDKSGIRRRTRRTPEGPLDREDRILRAKQDAETRTPREEPRSTRDRRPRRTLADILLDQARAETTAGTSDDLLFLREERARYAAQIRNLEKRKNLTDKQKERLAELYGQQAAAQGRVDAIISEGEQRITDQRTAAAEKRQAARDRAEARVAAAEEREEKRMAAIRESAAKRAEQRQRKFEGVGSLDTRAELRREALRGVRGQVAKDKSGGLTEADVRSMQFEFLTSLQGVMNQFGGNLMPAGGPDVNWFQQLNLMREQNAMIGSLASGVRQPGTKYAGVEIAHLFDGATF